MFSSSRSEEVVLTYALVFLYKIAHFSDLSSVSASGGIIQTFKLEKRPSGSVRGFGSDSDGDSTAEMLIALYEEFGAVASFAGTYLADSWNWTLPTVEDEIYQTQTTGENTAKVKKELVHENLLDKFKEPETILLN